MSEQAGTRRELVVLLQRAMGEFILDAIKNKTTWATQMASSHKEVLRSAAGVGTFQHLLFIFVCSLLKVLGARS